MKLHVRLWLGCAHAAQACLTHYFVNTRDVAVTLEKAGW